MACAHCLHTMQSLGLDAGGRRHSWCPRCGTLKAESPGREWYETPGWAGEVLPDLLAACEAALEQHRAHYAGLDDEANCRPEMLPIYRAMKAAVAKARGEQERSSCPGGA